MKFPNLKSGYSIVELIVYVAVFAALTVVIANAFIVLISFFSQTRSSHDILDSGNTAIERIAYEVSISNSVLGTSVLGTSPGVLELDSVDDSNNPRVVRFEMDGNGALNLSYDGTLVGNVLGSNLILTSLIFTTATTDNGDVVKIDMTLQDTRDETLRVENFSNIVNTKHVDPDATSGLTFPYGFHAGLSGVYMVGGITFNGDVNSIGPIKSFANSGGTGPFINTVTGNAFSSGSGGLITVDGSFGANDLVINGDASSHTVNNTDINGNLYCQSGTGNNIACDTTQADPAIEAIPDWSTQIAEWKAEAEAGNVDSYNFSTKTRTIGPKKLSGLQIYPGETLVLTGPVWVTGNFAANATALGNITIKLDPSYGSRDEVIITDASISVGAYYAAHNVTIEGSGSADSNVLFVSTSSTANNSVNKISGNAFFYVPNGQIVLNSGANIKGVVAKLIQMVSGPYDVPDVVTYSGGVMSLNFGPSVFSVTP